MIGLSQVAKAFDGRRAVDELSFDVRVGEIVCLLGPNGAGKSTTLRLIAGVVAPDRGQITIDGHPIDVSPRSAKRKLGYLPERVPLYADLRITEFLAFRAELKGVPRERRRKRVADALTACGLDSVAERRVGTLSKGMKQRVGLADALIGRPKALVLDEPTSGLDPNQLRDVRTLLSEHRDRAAILLSTHLLEEARAVADRVIVMANGQIVVDAETEELEALAAPTGIDVRLARPLGPTDDVDALLGDDDHARSARVASVTFPHTIAIEHRDVPPSEFDAWSAETIRRLVQADLPVARVTPKGGTLADVFVKLTEEAPKGDAPRSEDEPMDAGPEDE